MKNLRLMFDDKKAFNRFLDIAVKLRNYRGDAVADEFGQKVADAANDKIVSEAELKTYYLTEADVIDIARTGGYEN